MKNVSKILLRPILFIVVIAGSALALVPLFYFYKQNFSLSVGLIGESAANKQIEGNAVSLVKTAATSSTFQGNIAGLSVSPVGRPARLKIPKINVNASVEHVGLAQNGEMGVPKGPAGVAWLNLGPRPGEKGSAVIDGHFGWKNGIPAVFDNLYKLRKGDKIYIEDEKGVISTFVVRELRRYGEHDDASAAFGSVDGKEHLNLITCEGAWDKTKKSYSNRLVVFTDKEIK